MENLKKCNNDCCNPPALKPNDLNTNTPSNDCAPTWIPNFAYITQADLFNLYGFVPDADLNPTDTSKTNQVTMAIAYASERINTLTGNKIEGVGFNNLNITQQNLVQRATGKLTIYYLRDGMEFIRASVSYSGNGVAISSSPPSDPDYVPEEVYNLLQQANLYKVRQGHSINYCQRCNQNCNNTCTTNQIWRNDPGEQIVRWQNANMAFLRPPYVTSTGGTISINNTSTPTNAGINIETTDALSPILQRLILGSNDNTIAYAVTPTTFMGNDLITQTWLLSQLEPFQPVLQFTNPLLLTGNTVSFKIDTTGNIGLTVTTNGLKANLTTDNSLNFPSPEVLSALPLVTTNTFTINGTSQVIVNAITSAQQVGETNSTNIDTINTELLAFLSDINALKAQPIFNPPSTTTTQNRLIEIGNSTLTNVNHNLMFSGSGSPITSPIDPADTDGRSYVTLAYLNANSSPNLIFNNPLYNTGSGNNIILRYDSNSLKLASSGIPNLYASSLSDDAGHYIGYSNLNNLDNTSDLNKPISTATQSALDGKQIRFGTSTGWDSSCFQNSVGGQIYVKALTKAGISTYITYDQIDTAINVTLPGKQNTLVSGTNIKTVATRSLLGSGDIGLVKADVGLGNVDNTSDLNKPISTATQSALTIITNNVATNTTNIAKGFYWKPVTITGAPGRIITIPGLLGIGQTYRVGYNLTANSTNNLTLIYKEFYWGNTTTELDQFVTFTLLIVGNVTHLVASGATINITSNSGTAGFIVSLEIKEPLTL